LEFLHGFEVLSINADWTDLNCNGATNAKTYFELFKLNHHLVFELFAVSLNLFLLGFSCFLCLTAFDSSKQMEAYFFQAKTVMLVLVLHQPLS